MGEEEIIKYGVCAHFPKNRRAVKCETTEDTLIQSLSEGSGPRGNISDICLFQESSSSGSESMKGKISAGTIFRKCADYYFAYCSSEYGAPIWKQ